MKHRKFITDQERNLDMTMSLTLRRVAPGRRRVSVLSALAHFHGVWRQRQALKKLDDAQLRDIGITRAQAVTESRRNIWDAPSNWRR